MEPGQCPSPVIAVIGYAALVKLALLSVVLAVLYARWRKVRKELKVCFGRLHLVGYKNDPKLEAFEIAKALSLQAPKKPYMKGVLFVGGFGDCPIMWAGVIEHLKEKGWFYLAPRTPGWGRTHFAEANRVSWKEWILLYRDALLIVQGLCEEVTVVAHSTGAPIAAVLAETCPYERLICTGPNFLSNPNDLWAKRLLLRPFVGPLVTWYLNLVVKKRRQGRPIDSLNVAAYETAFYLTALPVGALRQMWMLQDELSHPWQVSGEVLLLMGEQDQSVGSLASQAAHVHKFVPEGVRFCVHSVPDAAHNLCGETPPVVDHVCRVISGEIILPVADASNGS